MTKVEQKTKLDDIDFQILKTLQEDGRITNAKLASKIGLSAPPMLERVKKLERAGIIAGYKAILNAEKLGCNFFVFVSVNLSVKELANVERIEKQLAMMDNVMECHHIAGDIDFLLKINVRNQEAYKKFVVDQLARIEGINKLHSYVVLSTIKDSNQLIV